MVALPADPKRFVLYSMPRTGSNMMVSLLKGHPRIACLPAIFSNKAWTDWSQLPTEPHTEKVHRLATLPEKWNSKKKRIVEMPLLLESLLDLYAHKDVFGFKQHMGGPKDRAARRVVRQRWPAVILDRKNVLAAYSSHKIVDLTGQGALRAGETPKRAKTEFVAEEFAEYLKRRLRKYEYWTDKIAASGVRMLTIEYCYARRPGGLAPVGEFLGVDPDRFGDPGTEKRNSDDILSRFSNPGDAERWLRANGHSDWAVED